MRVLTLPRVISSISGHAGRAAPLPGTAAPAALPGESRGRGSPRILGGTSGGFPMMIEERKRSQHVRTNIDMVGIG